MNGEKEAIEMTKIYKDGKKVVNLSIERHDVDFVELTFTFEDGTQEREVWGAEKRR